MGSTVFALDETTPALFNGIFSLLRSGEEAILHPQSETCAESGHFKNCVFRLSGDQANVPIRIFSPAWFAGVSVVKVCEADAEPILSNPARRAAAAEKLRQAIPSEMCDSSLQVGPALDGDADDRDAATWTPGFDSASCCVGLYCAEHSAPPEIGKNGMNRMHRVYYLVAKAGPGLAGSTFHTRLIAALKKGKTLDEALERGNDPGPQALRRVSLAGSRNRARILLLAANALGMARVDTLGDQASGSRYRGAETTADVSYNSLRKIEGMAKSTWQYTTAVDASVSTGLVSSSNVADGFILFLSQSGDVKVQLRNDAHSTIPFASQRLKSVPDMVTHVLSEWKRAIKNGETAHLDLDWISSTFVWKSREFGCDIDIEPLPLWGSHETENYISRFSRELGIASLNAVRLRPKLVCLSAIDPGKLRPVIRSLQASRDSTAVNLN